MSYFEWDESKAERNRLLHGIGFNDAAHALLGMALTRPSPRGEENRFSSIHECDGQMIVVVWTPRAGFIRIISARRARRNERAQFDQGVSGSAATRRH
ncbi:BrnT family toxin [Phenylobacterium sp.]|uniref:BrnT family toxin n=1 Tax=Phenylobacterium sp. TaxID=1871053 RepID=UPI0035241361